MLVVLQCVPVFARTVWVEEEKSPILGRDIGDEAGKGLGLSGDGQTLAFGAPYNDASALNAGMVRVYRNLDGGWTQIGQDLFGAEALVEYGSSISLSDDGRILAIGVPGSVLPDGLVRVYRYTGSTWQPLGNDPLQQRNFDKFGSALDLSGDGTVLAVGAPYYDSADNRNDDYGQVRVFRYSGAVWSQVGQTIVGQAADEDCGLAVSLSEDGLTLAVGSPHSDEHGAYSGQVRVFRYASGSWVQLGADIEGDQEFASLGEAISLNADGSRLAVGAPGYETIAAQGDGQVWVYQWTGQAWQQVGQALYDQEYYDYGTSVSLDAEGNRLAVGSPDSPGVFGAAQVYRLAQGQWQRVGYPVAGTSIDHLLGTSVALSRDGEVLATAATSTANFSDDHGVIHVLSTRERSPWGMFLPAILNTPQGQN